MSRGSNHHGGSKEALSATRPDDAPTTAFNRTGFRLAQGRLQSGEGGAALRSRHRLERVDGVRDQSSAGIPRLPQ